MIHLLYIVSKFHTFHTLPPPSLFLIFTGGTSAAWHAGPQQRSRRLYDPIPSFETALCGVTGIYKKSESISVYHDDSTVVTSPWQENGTGWINLEASWEATEWQSLLLACHVSQLLRMRITWSRKPKTCYLFLGIHHGHENRKLLLEWWSIVDCRCCHVYDGDGSMVCICDLPSHKLRKHRTNSSRQPAVLGKKCNKSEVSKALSTCFPVFATSPLAVLQAWHAPSEYWDPAIKNPLPSSKKVPINLKV